VERARLLAALMRVAYPVSVAMAGILPRTPLVVEGNAIALHLPEDLAALGSERLPGRLRQLARLVGLDARIRLSP
jgi:exopolyphosphatase/guanosine-5'-triphosphate,3'-diphosphate pyrophosphatase